MTTQQVSATVRTSITVEAPLERAFSVFTTGMSTWWPETHHIQPDTVEMVFEPRVGGRIYDRAADGSESCWARVLVFEPPTRLVFSWDITTQWSLETDPARTSEVEVRFVEEWGGRTRVELEHRHIDRHGDGWEQMSASVGSPDGWDVGLRRFADAVG